MFVYFSVCERVFAHTHKSVLWSDQCFSRHSIRWSVMYVTGCIAGAEGMRWKRERREDLGGGGCVFFIHSQDFFT